MWESPPNVGSLGTPSRPLTSDLPQLLGIPSGFQGTWSLQSRPSGAPGTPSPIHALTIQDGIARPIHLPITFSCPSGHKPTLSPTPRTHLGCHLCPVTTYLSHPLLLGSMSSFIQVSNQVVSCHPTCSLHLPGHQGSSSALIQRSPHCPPLCRPLGMLQHST